MSLKNRLKGTADRINALSLRERALLLLVVFAIVFLLWDVLMMKPVRDRQVRVQAELGQVRDRLSNLTTAIQQLASEQARDPNAGLRAAVGELNDEIGHLETRLARNFGDLAEPRQAVAVLAGLLADRDGLNLVSLENLPAEPLAGSGANWARSGIYVHRVRLVVDAGHAGVREYLALIEELPRGVFLESMHLTVPEWPANRVELILMSLSLDDNWLGV